MNLKASSRNAENRLEKILEKLCTKPTSVLRIKDIKVSDTENVANH